MNILIDVSLITVWVPATWEPEVNIPGGVQFMEVTAMQSRFLLWSGALSPLWSQGGGTEGFDLVREILEPEAAEQKYKFSIQFCSL